MKVGLIIPCYNEENAIDIFYEEVNKIFKNLKCEYELLFIDDGSKDSTFEKIYLLSLNANYLKNGKNIDYF